jgi:hypothetical protein
MGVLVIIFFMLVAILLRIYDPKIKGVFGEKRVSKQLNKLSPKQYKVFNDVLIRTDKGTSQIDHVVVSLYGVFVIETKNYSGWIHGNERSDYWTQTIYRQKTKFRNPIKQNWGHVYALKELLSDYKDVPFYPIVVFAGSAKLKNVDAQTPVIYDYLLYETIKRFNIPVLEASDVEKISSLIKTASIEDKQVRKQHVKQIRTDVKERQKKERSLICPKCNGRLVKRNGQYGEFYGCSNYPTCRYKIKA